MAECRYCPEGECPVGYGMCHCGCGEKTNVSKVTRANKNIARDEPLKVVRHHQVPIVRPESPSGCLYCEGDECSVGFGNCHCGCGEKTTLATYGSRWHKHQRGKPVRYLLGHARRKPVVWLGGQRAKACTGCREVKVLDEFTVQIGGAQNRAAKCASCTSEASRQRWKDKSLDPKEVRRRRIALIKSQGYLITIEELEEMEAKQNKLCALCLKPETRVLRGTLCSLAIDHCHDSQVVRGLLCARCNTGLGQFKDDVEVLTRAIKYIEKSREETL